jgi:vacuolar-type H+-ATPase subunit I/STV1
MIANLGVTDISPADRNKLAQLKFTQYSPELRNADTAIGKLHIDDKLKLELLKLQVHYLHNLYAVENAKKEMTDAKATNEKNIALVEDLTTTQGQLEQVRTENNRKFADQKKELDAVNKEKQKLELEKKEKIEELNRATAQLLDLQTVIQSKAKALTHIEGVDPHLSNQPQPKTQRNQSVVKLPNAEDVKDVKLGKVEVVNLTPDESKYIADLKTKLTNPATVGLPIDEFGEMFTIMRKHKKDIKNLLSDKKHNSYIRYYSTNNSSDHDTYYINILIDDSSSVNINIGIDNTTSEIVYYNKVNNPQSINITPNATKSVKGMASNVISNKMFRDCYEQINKLLNSLFPARSNNKYLKYKNKYLQLKKLYNL